MSLHVRRAPLPPDTMTQQALEYSAGITDKKLEPQRSIYVSTYGIVFLGTPHNGAEIARFGALLERVARAMLPSALLQMEPQLIAMLATQSETLQNVNVGFANIQGRYSLSMFHEAVKTNLGYTTDFVVDQTSAAPIMPGVAYGGIEATHSGVSKFGSKTAPGYGMVSSTIKRYAVECPELVRSRWIAEKVARRKAQEELAKEALGIYNESGPVPGVPHGTSQWFLGGGARLRVESGSQQGTSQAREAVERSTHDMID
jgi:hypothetical protein